MPSFSSTSKWASTGSTLPGGPFDLSILTIRAGIAILKITGKGAWDAFKHEGGGHRWQRVSPTEKRGRTHTSTITVAVLPIPSPTQLRIDPGDLCWKTCRGSGAGGQHRNVTDSAVQLTHLPTGISVRCENERSQRQNKNAALEVLSSRLLALKEAKGQQARNDSRKRQVGGGARGDKVRTIALQRGTVTDHVLGSQIQSKQYLRGEIDQLWK